MKKVVLNRYECGQNANEKRIRKEKVIRPILCNPLISSD
jgi:hypothetical protein